MRLQVWVAAPLFFIGTIIFPICFVIQRYWWKHTRVGRRTALKFNLTDKDIVDISNKVVSSLQAICAGVSGWIICLNCIDDVVHSVSSMSEIYAWFGIPYFVYDTFCMSYVNAYSLPEHQQKESSFMKLLRFIRKSPVIFIHHMIMAPIGWTLVVFYRDAVEPGDFFVGIIYLMECSTPFVSLRIILSKFKMKTSPLYALNGILMLLTFPVFRILSVAYAAILYSHQMNFPNVVVGFWDLPFHWKFIWITAVAPQIYWYVLMWKGLMKIFFSSNTEKLNTIPCNKEGSSKVTKLHSSSKND